MTHCDYRANRLPAKYRRSNLGAELLGDYKKTPHYDQQPPPQHVCIVCMGQLFG
jgi:hypothetical protein